MGRRRALDKLAKVPWPVGVVAGIAGFAAVQYVLPAWLSGTSSRVAHALTHGSALTALAWIILLACWLHALFSFMAARRRQRFLDARDGIDKLTDQRYPDFERQVADAFRHQGYQVEQTGLGSVLGGIDLVLSRHGRRILVQCRRVHREKVPDRVVEDLYELLPHYEADELRIAAVGGFSREAAAFAKGKPISVIDGHTLLRMVRDAQTVLGR